MTKFVTYDTDAMLFLSEIAYVPATLQEQKKDIEMGCA
jgi:hypothetical protein